MDRKDFLKISCNACLLGAAAVLLPGLTGCSPATPVFKTAAVNNQVELPLNLFANTNLQFVRPNGWKYDIAVQKMPDGNYQALLMQCTHMDNQLAAEQNGFSCSLHGSRFDSDGHVIKGPAELSLKKYTTTIIKDHLVINI